MEHGSDIVRLYDFHALPRTVVRSLRFLATLTFYIQTWDEYYTQTLTLGVVSGPVEGILTLCIVYAVTAVKGGGSFWQQSLFETIGVPRFAFIPDLIYDMPWNEAYMVYGGLVLVSNTLSRFVNGSQDPSLLGFVSGFPADKYLLVSAMLCPIKQPSLRLRHCAVFSRTSTLGSLCPYISISNL